MGGRGGAKKGLSVRDVPSLGGSSHLTVLFFGPKVINYCAGVMLGEIKRSPVKPAHHY